MRIAIVDDNAEDRGLLTDLIRTYAAINQIELDTEQFSDGETFLRSFRPYAYTVVFLDVFMDGIDGIETARRFRELDNASALVILTSSEDHRPEAFSVFASAYISKPCSSDMLFRAMDHILRIRTDGEKRLSFSFERKEYSLLLSEIVSLETDGNYLMIEDVSKNKYRTRMTVREAEKRLDGRFLKIIQGVIVNLDHVSQMTDSCCYMKSGAVFPVHIKQGKKLKQQWLNYKFAHIRQS